MSPWHGSAQNVSIMYPKFGHILDTSYTRLKYNFVVQPIRKCPKCDHKGPSINDVTLEGGGGSRIAQFCGRIVLIGCVNA